MNDSADRSENINYAIQNNMFCYAFETIKATNQSKA